MSTSPKKKTLSFRLGEDLVHRLDALATVIVLPGATPNRSHAILAAITIGLERIEADPSILKRKTGRRRHG